MKPARVDDHLLEALEMGFLFSQYADRFIEYDRRLAHFNRLSRRQQRWWGGVICRAYLRLVRWLYLKEFLREVYDWD